MNRQFANSVKHHLIKHVQGYVKFWLTGDDMEITIYGANGIIFQVQTSSIIQCNLGRVYQ